MKNAHIHTWDDGRGNRDVFVNGKLVKQVIYAHTRKGIVRYCPQPLKLDKHKKRVISRTLHGDVVVVPAQSFTPHKPDHCWVRFQPTIHIDSRADGLIGNSGPEIFMPGKDG